MFDIRKLAGFLYRKPKEKPTAPFVPVHHHLIVSAEVNDPPKTPEDAQNFLSDVVEAAGMTVISGPYAELVEEPGNEGVTAVTILAESHTAIHVWDSISPARVEFDLYSCKEYDVELILNLLNRFEPVDKKWKFLNRDIDLEPDCECDLEICVRDGSGECYCGK